jgi:integrase
MSTVFALDPTAAVRGATLGCPQTPFLGSIYGGGRRLRKCLNLRVKDIDFNRHRLMVVQGKAGKARETRLPESIRQELHNHLQWAWKLYLKDR